MARLDMGRILRSGRFAREILLMRRAAEVNDYGRVVDAETPQMIVAIVQPAGAEDLERLPEGDAAKGAVNVWTETRLVARSEDRLPDEIEWDGSRWLVAVADWWPEGTPFCAALCVRQEGQMRGG